MKPFIYKCEDNENIYNYPAPYKDYYYYPAFMINTEHKYHNHKFIIIIKKEYSKYLFDENDLMLDCLAFSGNWDSRDVYPKTRFKRYYEEDV